MMVMLCAGSHEALCRLISAGRLAGGGSLARICLHSCQQCRFGCLPLHATLLAGLTFSRQALEGTQYGIVPMSGQSPGIAGAVIGLSLTGRSTELMVVNVGRLTGVEHKAKDSHLSDDGRAFKHSCWFASGMRSLAFEQSNRQWTIEPAPGPDHGWYGCAWMAQL